MWIYASQAMMLAVSIATLVLLVWLVSGRNPFRELRSALGFLLWDRRYLGALVAAVGMFAIDSVETAYFEPFLARHVHWDFTEAMAQMGTGLLHLLQRLEWAPLTHLLTFVYVIAFPLFLLASMAVYAARNDWLALKRLLLGYYANYLVALPFYLLVPVKEAWAGSAGIRFLIPQVYPAFEAQYRAYSGLDNCFPSLHTSLALTYALVAWRNGYRRLAVVLSVAAGLVMLSTLYLGIHWVPDLLAGAGLAVLAAGVVPMPAAAGARPAAAEGNR